MSRHLTDNVGEIFRGDIHQGSIVVDIPRQLVVTLHQHHKMVEKFTHPIRLHLIRTKLWIALEIFMKAYEKSLQLAKHQLGDTRTLRLLEEYIH